jgi:LPS sulfotransferase NodH
MPEEFFNLPAERSLLEQFQAGDYEAFRQKLWEAGSTPNGVFGIKVNAPRKANDPIIEELKRISGLAAGTPGNFEVWNQLFPGFKHIVMTRRNKIRQAVSWWKAIVCHEWHRNAGEERPYDPDSIRDRYDFDAIHHLLLECALREAKIQDMLTQAGAVPLTIVYEDFVRQYEETIRRVVAYLGIEHNGFSVRQPSFERLADGLSDEWTERFRVELQQPWETVIW